MDTIGQVIKTVRKQKGLKQIDVAKEMTVSQSYISQIENEVTAPTSMFIKLFCLQYSIDEKTIIS